MCYGQETMATFDRDTGTVSTADGRKGAYTRPEGSRTIEIKGDMPMTLTFDADIKFEQGHTMGYRSSDGRTGRATIASVG